MACHSSVVPNWRSTPRSFLPSVVTVSHATCVQITMARHWPRLVDGSSEPILNLGVKDERAWWSWPPKSVGVGGSPRFGESTRQGQGQVGTSCFGWAGKPGLAAPLGFSPSVCECLRVSSVLAGPPPCWFRRSRALHFSRHHRLPPLALGVLRGSCLRLSFSRP